MILTKAKYTPKELSRIYVDHQKFRYGHNEEYDIAFSGINSSKMPEFQWNDWKIQAKMISGRQIEPILTGFGLKLIQEDRLTEWFALGNSFIQQIAEEYPDWAWDIEIPEMTQYIKEIGQGVFRSTRHPEAITARLFLGSPEWHSVQGRWERVVPLPAFGPVDVLRVKGDRSLGFPWLRSMSSLTLGIDSVKQGLIGSLIRAGNDLGEGAMLNLGRRIYPSNSFVESSMKFAIKNSLYTGVAVRNQGGGRCVYYPSKLYNFFMMMFDQGLADALASAPWNFTGDRLLQTYKIVELLRKKGQYRYIVDGDDFIIIFPDGTVFLGDAHSFDEFVIGRRIGLFLKQMSKSIAPAYKDLIRRYIAIYWLSRCAPVAWMCGLLSVHPSRVLFSGFGNTHNLGGWYEANNIENAKANSADDVIMNLNKFQPYREDKQIVTKGVLSISQKIYLPNYKFKPADRFNVDSFVFGKISRFFRNAVFGEDYTPLTSEIADEQFLSKISWMYGSPIFYELVEEIKSGDYWEFRADPATLLLKSMERRGRPSGAGSTGGGIERAARLAVLGLFKVL